jgi:hypothetical protein
MFTGIAIGIGIVIGLALAPHLRPEPRSGDDERVYAPRVGRAHQTSGDENASR